MEADPNFEGFPGSDCGEHRTVGPHRAWCYACTTWCYPDVPCPGCHVPILEAEVERLRGVVEERDREIERMALRYGMRQQAALDPP